MSFKIPVEEEEKETENIHALLTPRTKGGMVLLFTLRYKELVLWPQLNYTEDEIMIFPRAQGREIIW